jgi:5'-phosphate synthase pdxT subunit
VNPAQESLGLLDATIARNVRPTGRFVQATLDAPLMGGPIEAVFIRAPRFQALGAHVETLAALRGEPVRAGGTGARDDVPPELTGIRSCTPFF